MIPKKVLILDDEEIRHQGIKNLILKQNLSEEIEFIHCYSSDMAIKELENSKTWSLIFLDHDLGLFSACLPGYDAPTEDNSRVVADYLAEHKDEIVIEEMIVIHSMNVSGATRLYNTLNYAGYSVVLLPFNQLIKR